jgi:hypothetical protein
MQKSFLTLFQGANNMYDHQMSLRFELEDEDGKLTREFTVEDAESWTKLVLKFTDFLSAQYGYCISEKVLFIADYPYGIEKEYAISSKEYEMIKQYRKREAALDSLFDDEDLSDDDYAGCPNCVQGTCLSFCGREFP